MHLCYEHRTAVQINNYSIERQIKFEQPVRWLIFGDTALQHPDVQTVQRDVVTVVRVDFSHLLIVINIMINALLNVMINTMTKVIIKV